MEDRILRDMELEDGNWESTSRGKTENRDQVNTDGARCDAGIGRTDPLPCEVHTPIYKGTLSYIGEGEGTEGQME